MPSIIIDERFCGAPNSGNAGYVCGRLARYIPGGAKVTMLVRPPLKKPLDVVAMDDGSWELRDEVTVVAIARPERVRLTRLEEASFQEARRAELATPREPNAHPQPTCFGCGPARANGDGLRILAAPLLRQPRKASAVLAATWTPDPALAADDGFVAPEFLWAALDCPTGQASSYHRESASFERTPILLDRMSAWIENRPRPGERCVITAWEIGRDGLKRVAEAAAYGESGALLAVAQATWVPARQVQVGCA